MRGQDYVFALPGSATPAGFVWFLTSIVQHAFVWLTLVLLLIVLVVAYWRAEPLEIHKYLLLLLIPPALWIFIGLWGSFFWVDWTRKPFVPNPDWVQTVMIVALLASVLSGVGLVIYLRGARAFAVIYVLINLFFAIAMAFFASMAVTGTWL